MWTHQLETAQGEGEKSRRWTQKEAIARCTHRLETKEGGKSQDTERKQRARHTNQLETKEGGTGHDMERKQLNEGRSPTGDNRERNKLGHRRKTIEQGALTIWRRQKDGQVRTWKENNRARDAHRLEMAEGGTSQNTEAKQPSGAHSPTSGGQVRLGHRKKVTK